MDIPNLRIDASNALDLSGATVDVFVGSKPWKKFTVHDTLLRSNAHWHALETCWDKKDQHEGFFLEDHSPASFDVYVNWLYCRKIPVQTSATLSEKDAIQSEYLELAKAYKLGEILWDRDFMDAVMDTIMARAFTKNSEGQNWPPGPATMDCLSYMCIDDMGYMATHTAMVDLYRNFGHFSFVDGDLPSELCDEFVRELAVQLLRDRKRAGNKNKYLIDLCKYHCHDKGSCYRDRLALGEVVREDEEVDGEDEEAEEEDEEMEEEDEEVESE